MYYFQTNKKNPTNTNCNSKKAKVIKSLCNFAVLISIGIASITSSFAEQQLTYGNYPILRGLTNPQEVSENFKISDAGLNLRQMVMLSSLDIIKPSKGKISPNKKITNNELIKAMVKLSGLDKQIQPNDPDINTRYKEQAVALGLFTQEWIDKNGTEKYMNSAPTMKTVNNYFSKVMNTETKYNTSPTKQATRLDIANLIYQNKDVILAKNKVDIYSGQIITKSQIVEDGKNKSLITVKLDKNLLIKKQFADKEQQEKDQTAENIEYATNQIDKIAEENKEDSTVVSYVNVISQKDVLVLTPSGVTTDTKYIWPQSQINIYVKNNKILYAEQYSVPTKEITGVFESITVPSKDLEEIQKSSDTKTADNTTNVLKIKDYNNKVHLYKLHPDVKILQYSGELGDFTAVSKPVSADDLVYGQDVQLTLRNNVVTILKAYVPVEEELNSYVAPESEMIGGTVLDVSENNITLTNNKDYTIGPDTLIMKDGQIEKYTKIKDGDRIKLYFDDIYSNVPSKVEIEGSQRQADKILKAKVGPYLLSQKSLNLKDVKELQNGQWVDLKEDIKAYETIKVRGNIYANSSKVSTSKLKNYKNQEIYAVIAKNQGIPTIEKGKIRIGDSLKFDDSIKTIDYSQNTMNIDDNLIKFDESTIFVKDGNIVQSGNIEKNVGSNIETNLTKDAQIVIQNGSTLNPEKMKNYPYKIYRATLRDVFEYSLLLGNDIENSRKVNHYFMWQGGQWTRLSEGKTTPRINFTEQTKVYDYDANKGYSIDQIREYKNAFNSFGIRPEYYNKQVYVVTKDDVALFIAFKKDEGYVQVNSQNLMVAKGVGEYKESSTDNNNTANNTANNANKNNTNTSAIQKILVKNIQQYNSNTKKLESLNPIVTTDTSTQEIKKTPIRKIINIDKATVVLDGKVIQKTSVDALKDRELTIVYRQIRDKKTTDGIEELDAIAVLAN